MKIALTFTLWLLLHLSAIAQQQQSGIAEELRSALESHIGAGGDQESGRALFDQAILSHGNPLALLSEFDARLAQENLVPAERIAILRLKTAVLQRHGDLALALATVEAELELQVSVDSVIQRGQLLDCLERRDDALAVYAHALELLPQDDPRFVTLMLRRAMLSMQGDNQAKDALAEFAASEACDPEMRNRAAVVLALLGRPQDAIDLFVVEGEGSKLFRQQIRMAEWALQAKDANAAQEWAWLARQSATLKRDRFYALTVLSEAHRLDNSLDRLLEAFRSAEDLDQQSYDAWIALLRETGEYDVAVAMFEQGNAATGFSNTSRRELLEMYREAGRADEMIEQYKLLMKADPDNSLWPEGLSRYYLEQGMTQQARDLWQYFLTTAKPGLGLVEAAKALMGLGQDDLAIICAERCVAADVARFAALQFLFDMHRLRGELELAAAVLERTDQLAPPDSAARMQLSESFERIGNLERAVEVLEQLRNARDGVGLSEDLEMRLAWLHSEVGNEELALQRWRNLWLRVDSIPRRRYVEDRMMSVASRLGKLADIAIELEGRLYRGEADKRDSGLLVRLYTEVGDPVSATEIIEDFLKQAGGSEIEALEEKARVFMSCTDYHNYERTVRRLIAINPEGEAEYLQQIAMSMLERGKPDLARTVLARLKELESDVASAEFEAGVLALAGMEVEAITAYARGLANNPDRIESYLMMAALMQQIGAKDRAIGMFQDIALNADRDDLFIIAIDGLLNLEAPNSIMNWARRITLERLARRHDKVYLYQLLADIGEQVNDSEARIAALQGSLAIAADRRVSVVRELMDLSAGRNNSFTFNGPQGNNSNQQRHLAYGRRLIGLGQLVPPQVYLDLGRTFLSQGAIADASKTFRLARDLPDYDVFQRQVGGLFEQSGYLNQALAIYGKVLIGDSTNVGLLVKVGELHEQLSNDLGASGLYRRAVELLLARRPLVTGDQAGESAESFSRWHTRNVDDFDKFFNRATDGLLVAYPQQQVVELLEAQSAIVATEIREAIALQPSAAEALPLHRFPRLFRRTLFVRRLALSYGEPSFAAAMDHNLLAAFPKDPQLLGQLVKERVRWGLNGAAYDLLMQSGRESEQIEKLLWLVGKGVAAGTTELVPMDEALRLLLPLMVEKHYDAARLLLRRVDFGGVGGERNKDAGALFAAAAMIGDQDLILFLGRNWLRLFLSGNNQASSYKVRPVLTRVGATLNEEYRRSFFQYFVQLVLDDTDKYGALIVLLPAIQEQVAEPLLEQEKLVELISENHRSLTYSLGPLLKLAPEENRAGLASIVWAELAPTMRTYFIFNLIDAEIGPLGADMDDQLVLWFEELLEGEDMSMFRFGMDDITSEQNLENNGPLVARLVATLEQKKPDSPLALVARARLLLHDKQQDAAVEKGLQAYFLPEMQEEDNWDFYNARNFIQEEIIPLAPKRFLERLDEQEQGLAADLKRWEKRLNIVLRLNDDELYFRELNRACEQLPEELTLLRMLHGQRSLRGELEAADQLLANMVEQFPEDVGLAEMEFNSWLSRARPVKAVEALHRLNKLQGAAQQSDPEEEVEAKLTDPNILAVKKAVDAQDFVQAGNILRRMWRDFPTENQNFYFYRNTFWTAITWPQNVKTDEELTAEELAKRQAQREITARGGLDAYYEPDKNPRQQPNAWEVLATYPFGVAEMERFLRSNGPSNLENYTAIIDGLAVSRVLAHGEDQAISELLDKVAAGDANRIEILQLLFLLQRNPTTLGAEVQQVLQELTSSLHPRDVNQLLRLANVMVAAGEREHAIDLYRWCSTQTSTASYYGLDEEDFNSLDVGRLVREMRESLKGGDDMIAIIDQALLMAKPDDNPWEMASYQRLVLDTWIGLLGPGQALQRCRDICAKADIEQAYRWNNFSDTAAWLYAHENELDRAMECLDFYLDGMRWQSIRQDAYPRFFPQNSDDWQDPVGWYNRIGPALLTWVSDGKLNQGDGLRATALVVVRLFEKQAIAAAEQLLQQLLDMPFESAATSLWIADAARRIGNGSAADQIEADLFARNLLGDARVAEHLQRMLVEEGAEAVLAYGEEMLSRRRPKILMELMLRVATETANQHAIDVWTARVDDAQRARAEIEAYLEEMRAKAQR